MKTYALQILVIILLIPMSFALSADNDVCTLIEPRWAVEGEIYEEDDHTFCEIINDDDDYKNGGEIRYRVYLLDNDDLDNEVNITNLTITEFDNEQITGVRNSELISSDPVPDEINIFSTSSRSILYTGFEDVGADMYFRLREDEDRNLAYLDIYFNNNFEEFDLPENIELEIEYEITEYEKDDEDVIDTETATLKLIIANDEDKDHFPDHDVYRYNDEYAKILVRNDFNNLRDEYFGDNDVTKTTDDTHIIEYESVRYNREDVTFFMILRDIEDEFGFNSDSCKLPQYAHANNGYQVEDDGNILCKIEKEDDSIDFIINPTNNDNPSENTKRINLLELSVSSLVDNVDMIALRNTRDCHYSNERDDCTHDSNTIDRDEKIKIYDSSKKSSKYTTTYVTIGESRYRIYWDSPEIIIVRERANESNISENILFEFNYEGYVEKNTLTDDVINGFCSSNDFNDKCEDELRELDRFHGGEETSVTICENDCTPRRRSGGSSRSSRTTSSVSAPAPEPVEPVPEPVAIEPAVIEEPETPTGFFTATINEISKFVSNSITFLYNVLFGFII